MTPAEIHSQLAVQFGAAVIEAKLDALDPSIEIAADSILEVARYLKSDPNLRLDALNDLSAVDYCEPDAAKQKKFGHEPHLEVVYHLYSYTHKHWIVIKVKLPRWKNDQAGEIPELASVSSVWAIADWHEREAYDMMGIRFTAHPNLRRILTSEDWVGYPLRKDYEFPTEYHGIRNH